jgi:small subunit ribosomal protein S1
VQEQPLYLGIKQLAANPADAIRKKYPPKTVVHGKVTEAGANGVRFVLDDKRVAFASASEIDPAVAYKAGEKVSAIVIGVHPSTFELTVSINKFEEIRDRKRLAQYLKAPPPLTLGQVLSPEKQD